MSFSKILDVVSKVLTNKDVIFIFALVILYLNFVFFIMRYKKKPKLDKKKIEPIVKEKKSDTENDEDSSEEDEEDDNEVYVE